MHIHDVCFDSPEMFIGFGLLDESGFVSLHPCQALIREKRIPSPARGFRNMVLREPVKQIDIRSQEMLDARHLADNEITVMHHEL
jgi:hypothetical protein